MFILLGLVTVHFKPIGVSICNWGSLKSKENVENS